jgi:hypothetical protein
VLPSPCPDSVTRGRPVHTPIQAPGLSLTSWRGASHT